MEDSAHDHPHKEHPSVTLRAPQPGDMGWVVQRHGELYAREYGWSQKFEGLVAGIVSEFVKNFNPEKERCWIAECNGVKVGSIILAHKTPDVAQLRLLLVDPDARRMGIGTALVSECARFARKAGYRKITLWTDDILADARRIYERAGYKLVRQEKHAIFGEDLVGQTWELEL